MERVRKENTDEKEMRGREKSLTAAPSPASRETWLYLDKKK